MQTLKTLCAFVGYICGCLIALWMYPRIIKYCAMTLGKTAYIAGHYCYLILMVTILLGFVGIVITLLKAVLSQVKARPTKL